MAKNPAAVALGRLGGQVRGVAKGFGALTPAQRQENSRKAAAARWGKKSKAKR